VGDFCCSLTADNLTVTVVEGTDSVRGRRVARTPFSPCCCYKLVMSRISQTLEKSDVVKQFWIVQFELLSYFVS